MADADVEALRRGFEAYERGDMETALRNIAPDFVVNDHIIMEDSTDVRGPEAMAKNLERVGEAFPRMRYEILEAIDLDDRVVLRVVAHLKGATTGLEWDQEVGQLWVIEDGLAKSLDIYPSWEQARRAAGVDDGT